jgi:hypothetical protein
MPVGYFGGSTGAAAALVASVEACRSSACGRVAKAAAPISPARRSLARARAATLLIVLFDESGALDEVARLARGWLEFQLLHAEIRRSAPEQTSQ